MLTRFAQAAPRAGIELSIACLTELDGNPAAEPLYARGTPPFDLGLDGPPRVHALLTARRYIARIRPQVVHTHLGTSDMVGGLTARSLGIPLVSTIHAMDWSSEGRSYGVKRRILKHCAARVIAVSDSARQKYLEHGWARPDQIVTIHNGIDAIPAAGAGAEVRRELGLEPDAVVVGMVSGLRPEKGHDVAIETVGLLREQYPKLRLLIVGQGHLREQIERQAAGRLGEAAVFAGGRPDVMRVFDAIDICLHPSRADAFPTTLIEAMAASVPVIATAVGGIPEIITDGITGLLIPAPPSPNAVATLLRDLIDDPPRRRALAQAGHRAYAERFTADPWVRRTRELYDEVVAARGPRTVPAR
jgi:glycosyltransferase involved in cell wall biosynthesis